LIFFVSKFVIGQDRSYPAPDSLKSGLYVKSIEKIIPWHTSLKDIHIYGNPKITAYRKKFTVAEWGNVEFLNGIKGSLAAYFWRTSDNARMSYIIAYLDSNHVHLIKDLLESFLNKQGTLRGVTKKTFFYEWKLYGCLMRLGLFKTGEYFFWIQRKK
jgi:hypothetical protein